MLVRGSDKQKSKRAISYLFYVMANDARKTRDEKELIYYKIVCNGDFGVAMPVFILV